MIHDMKASTDRRSFIRSAAAGTLLVAFGGGSYVLASTDDPRAKIPRKDGRPRVPPGQRIIDSLKPMGGDPGDPSPKNFRLKVHGEVDNPFEIDFAGLLAMPQTTQVCDVHCVTAWTMLDSKWTGVQVAHLAKLAKVRAEVKHVIFEAAKGYTANVPLAEAIAPNVLLAHKLGDNPLPRPHGPPVRAVVPDLYFWKSAKWLTGIYFSRSDKKGYWETRGYHNHADPWKEERYA